MYLIPSKGHLIFTPINSLLYNMQYENLAIHGIHPRITHILVNMPMLYNIGFILFVYVLVRNCRRLFNKKEPFVSPIETVRWQWPLLGTVVIGALLLSMAPHQEPRYWIP